MHAIPLARSGCAVLAIDASKYLLGQLKHNIMVRDCRLTSFPGTWWSSAGTSTGEPISLSA